MAWAADSLSIVLGLTTTASTARRAGSALALSTGVVTRRPALALVPLFAVSAVARAVFAVRHSIPHYFPDEYIYAALGRALGHGNLQVRGATTHFPGILEPLLAAPIWRAFSTDTAYHLIQVENAVIASLAAFPIYFLARWLKLSGRYALFCAVLGLALPEIALSALTISDMVAYPLILTTVLVGVRALHEPSTRRQVAFLMLATLSSLARVEYAVVVVAYLVAAIVVDRRHALRSHWVSFGAVIPAAAAVLIGARSYYLTKGTPNLSFHVLSLGHWFVLQAFLLTIATGVVLVPGALAALLRPIGRTETAYAAFTLTFSLLVLAAATEPAAVTTRFKERYLFSLVPLLAIAFGVYLRRRPLRPLVLALCVGLAIALAEFPLSGYTAANYKGDSTLLMGTWNLQLRVGTSSASLIVALAATIGCLLAIATAFRRLQHVALGFALLFLLVSCIFATAEDLRATREIRGVLTSNLSWVDDAANRPVTVVATTHAPSFELRETLFWNQSIKREVVLPGAVASDVLSTPTLAVRANGELEGVHGDVLFDESGAVGALRDASEVTGVAPFILYRPHGLPRFSLLIDNRYFDGWLGAGGSIRAWPTVRGRGVRVSFTVSLPRRWKRVRLHLGRTTVVVLPAGRRRMSCRSGFGPLDVPYSSPDALYDLALRHVSLRLTKISITDVPADRKLTGAICAASE